MESKDIRAAAEQWIQANFVGPNRTATVNLDDITEALYTVNEAQDQRNPVRLPKTFADRCEPGWLETATVIVADIKAEMAKVEEKRIADLQVEAVVMDTATDG